MSIVITGGAGFIGSNLVHKLAAQNHTELITVVDNFSSGDFHNLNNVAVDVITESCDKLDWEARFGSNVDTIYHLASITDTTLDIQPYVIERNVEGFRKVLDYATKHNCRIVYASSAAVYGQANGIMTEEQQLRPVNVYGFSKMVMDNLAKQLMQKNYPIVGLRYFNVYGPGESYKGMMASMIYQLIKQMMNGDQPQIFRDGTQKRDFVYIDDVIRATIIASKTPNYSIYNIGSGMASSFNEVISILRDELNLHYKTEYIDNPYEDSYQHYTQADLTSAYNFLGYHPKYNLKRGITEYIKQLKET